MAVKVEMHLHVKGTSSCAHVGVKEIIKEYKDKGYSGIVCTNHFNETSYKYLFGITNNRKIKTFFNAFDSLKEEGLKNNIKVYFGMELALKGEDYCLTNKECTEILVYGITKEEFLELQKSILYLSHEELLDMANKKGWVLVQSHPFRPRTRREKLVHGAEVINTHTKHDNKNNLAKEYAKENNFIETCGSDYHDKGMAKGFLEFENIPLDEKELAKLLKERKYKIPNINY